MFLRPQTVHPAFWRRSLIRQKWAIFSWLAALRDLIILCHEMKVFGHLCSVEMPQESTLLAPPKKSYCISTEISPFTLALIHVQKLFYEAALWALKDSSSLFRLREPRVHVTLVFTLGHCCAVDLRRNYDISLWFKLRQANSDAPRGFICSSMSTNVSQTTLSLGYYLMSSNKFLRFEKVN